ncbi:hypothetical protein B0H14DRAFT_3136075 [Mycena olivaceomarginata]|nr:hypothetical protein B0H14DRAFT_3136075 [Mycena olivaceomarginata]
MGGKGGSLHKNYVSLGWPKAERGNLDARYELPGKLIKSRAALIHIESRNPSTHKLHLRRTKVGRRNLVERRGKSTGRAHPSQSYRKAIRSDEPVPIIPRDREWDGWPDGDFSALFSMSFVEKHDNLHVHWATQILGGRAGDTDAAVWKDGKLTRRQCQGIIQCESVDCSVVTCPQTRKAGVENQLSKLCICGSIFLASGGVYYQNGGTHDHPRPTVRLHLAKEERDEFAAIVREQPKTGPLKLVVGRPTASGPAQSVAKISPLLVNADRVKYERQKVLRGSRDHGGDHFLSEFAKIEASNPNFICSSQFGLVSVIVMQTPFLASRLIKAISVDTEAVNGIVSDAAHGFWADPRRMSPYTFNAGFPA